MPLPPPAWVGACAPGLPQEQTLVGGTHAEEGLKKLLSSTGYATKEEKLKSLLAAAGTTDSHPCCCLHKLRICRMFKWTSAPAAEMGLGLAAVDFVGTHMWGLDPVRIRPTSIAPTAGPGTQLLQSWDMNSVDLHW